MQNLKFELGKLCLIETMSQRKTHNWRYNLIVGGWGGGSWLYLFYFFNPHRMICLLIYEREEGGGETDRQTETSMWETNIYWLPPIHTHHDWGLNPQPRYGPWLGITPTIFCTKGWCFKQLHHLAMALIVFKDSLHGLRGREIFILFF